MRNVRGRRVLAAAATIELPVRLPLVLALSRPAVAGLPQGERLVRPAEG